MMDYTPGANGLLIPPTPSGGAGFPMASPAAGANGARPLTAPNLHNLMHSFSTEGDPIASPHVNASHLSTLQTDESGRVGRYVVPQVFSFNEDDSGGAAATGSGAAAGVRLNFQDARTPSPRHPSSGAAHAHAGGVPSSASHPLKHLSRPPGGGAGGAHDASPNNFREVSCKTAFAAEQRRCVKSTRKSHLCLFCSVCVAPPLQFLDYLQSPNRSPRHLQKTSPNSAGSTGNSPPPSASSHTSSAPNSTSAAALSSRPSASPTGVHTGLPPLQTPPKLSSHSTSYSSMLASGMQTTPVHATLSTSGSVGLGSMESAAGSSSAMPPAHPSSSSGLFSPMAQLNQTLTSTLNRSKLQTPSSAALSGISPRNAYGFSPAVSPRNINLASALLHSPSIATAGGVGGNAGAASSGAATRSGNNSRSTSPFRGFSSNHLSVSGGGGAGGAGGASGNSGGAATSTSPLPSPSRHVSLNIHRSSFSPPASPSARSPSNSYAALLNSSNAGVGGAVGGVSGHPATLLPTIPSPFPLQRKLDGVVSGSTMQVKEESPESKRMHDSATLGDLATPAAAGSASTTAPSGLAAPTTASGSPPPVIQPNPANASRQRRFDFAAIPASSSAPGATPAKQDGDAGAPVKDESLPMALATPTSYFS